MNTNPLKYKSYIAYVKHYGKHTPFIAKIYYIFKFFRKYILVGKIFRYAKIIFLWLETGTFFLLFATVFIILLPIIILILLGLYLYTLSIHRKYNKIFAIKIQDTLFEVTFLDNEKSIENNYKTTSNTLKIIVIKSPFTQLHSAVKKAADNTYIISLYYFYSLKRKVLDKHPNNVTYLS